MRREVPHDHGLPRPSRGGKPIWGILSTGSAALHPWLHSSAPLGPVDQCPIDLPNKAEVARHDKIVGFVEQMLTLHKQLSAAKTGQDKTVIQRQIDATDRQIDELVYELYGLTDDEIRIVEEATAT